MKKIICITVFLMTLTQITFCQSVMDFPPGSSLELPPGSDISADVIKINGTFVGGGTINGNTAYVLSLMVFLEGFYNPASDTMISDTIKVYLRNTASPYELIDSCETELDASGLATCIFTNADNEENYYVVVSHRNSIETWSAAGQSFNSFSMVKDFSGASSQAYGNNLVQVNTLPVRFAIYAGDVNQNGIVDGVDLSLADTDAFNYVTGYVNTDVNGDEVVDASDMAIVDTNAYNFVSAQRPF